jgi:hypothetical protein
MSGSSWSDLWLSEFEEWEELDGLLHFEIPAGRKFRDLKACRYDRVILHEPTVPKGRAASPSERRLNRRRCHHKETCMLLLSKSGFVHDVMAVSRQWQLDKQLYLVQADDFWEHRRTGAWCWWMFLSWLSLTSWPEREQEAQLQKSLLADRFRADHDLVTLQAEWRKLGLWTPRNRFVQDVNELMRRYGLSPLWYRSVEALILSGYMPVPCDNCRLVFQTGRDRRLFVELFQDSRKEDIDDLWPSSQEALSRMFPQRLKRRRMRSRLTRDIDTEQSRNGGRSLEDIVVNDHDLDAREDEFATREAMAQEENRSIARLGQGTMRLKSARSRVFAASVLPLLLKRTQVIYAEEPESLREWNP